MLLLLLLLVSGVLLLKPQQAGHSPCDGGRLDGGAVIEMHLARCMLSAAATSRVAAIL